MAAKTPVVLTILDGWGFREQVEGNAVALARKPTFDHLITTYPYTLIGFVNVKASKVKCSLVTASRA